MNSIVNSFRREARRLAASPWDLAMVTWVPLLGVAVGSVAGMGVNFVSARWLIFRTQS